MPQLPNRAERRKYNKQHKTRATLQDFALAYAVKGIQNNEDISWLKPYLPTDLIAHKDNWDLFPDGTKIKLNYEGVMSRPQKYLSDEFKAWIEVNKDEEFTIFRDPEDENRKGLIAVRYIDESKDTEQSKAWLFDLYSDLLVWSKYEDKYVLPQSIEDMENQLANVKQSLAMIKELAVEDVTEEENAVIEYATQAVQDHENGARVIANAAEWGNIDSDLQTIIEKIVTPDDLGSEEEEEESEVIEGPAEVIEEEKATIQEEKE